MVTDNLLLECPEECRDRNGGARICPMGRCRGEWLQSCAELLEDRAAVSSGAGGRLRRTRCNHSVFPVFFLLLSTAGRQLGLLGKLTELDETAVNQTPDWAQHSPITVQS